MLLGEFLHEASRLQEAKAGPQTCELRPKRKAGQGVQSCLLAASRTAAVHNAQCTMASFIFTILKHKEIVERRHGEPIKFLFLPRMGLLGSQAGNEKTAGCEL